MKKLTFQELENIYLDCKSQKDTCAFILDSFEESVYRSRLLKYRTQDAKNHIEEMAEINDWEETSPEIVNELIADAEDIAEIFLDNYDCNQPENELWESLIQDGFDAYKLGKYAVQ